MLRVNERKRFSSPVPVISRSDLEKIAKTSLLQAGPSMPLIVRDGFIAETANKIDELQGSTRVLARDVDVLASKVAALHERSDQEHRWYRFRTSEQRARDAKLDEMVRHCRDLKARLDKMDARSNGNFHAYNSFEAVSRKLAELEQFKDEAQRVERGVLVRTWLFSAALVLSALIIVASDVLPG